MSDPLGDLMDAARGYWVAVDPAPWPITPPFLEIENELWVTLVRARNAWLTEIEKERTA